ncbi:molybdenum cofactor biosynthesis protein MoaE [Kocuria sp.]|uniref:molybdenum cofactor biosynthesis protein MoaE n=1 Tax=Kocuria sp. TaxID=1871328 RepID=UPI0026DCE57F|nr:molybdenum cofactor biosynthesis protein MoaE [Kocuria sp.]MDO4918669.1 molybdenum cofactor biosynthesis protein MoaE [Kocuria sp.]
MTQGTHRHAGTERPPHRDEVGDYHLTNRRAEVVVVSSSAARGEAEDRCGPLLREWLERRGMRVTVRVVPDGPEVLTLLRELTADAERESAPRFVVTSGGTGLNSDDVTPESTARVVAREAPGIMHALWATGLEKTPTAVMSRGVAGHVGRTFLVNLPGSRGGVKDGIAVLDPLLDHISAQLEDVHGHGEDRSVTRSGEETVPAGGTPADAAGPPRAGPAASSGGGEAAHAGRESPGEVLHAGTTEGPLDAARARLAVSHPSCGAVVGFSGVIRDHDGGREGVTALEYSAHPSAGQVLADVAQEVAREHPGTRLWAAHRTGALAVGDSALEVAVAAAHRREAFEACALLVDRIKERVPIWKRESFDDGGHTWVGLDA